MLTDHSAVSGLIIRQVTAEWVAEVLNQLAWTAETSEDHVLPQDSAATHSPPLPSLFFIPQQCGLTES